MWTRGAYAQMNVVKARQTRLSHGTGGGVYVLVGAFNSPAHRQTPIKRAYSS